LALKQKNLGSCPKCGEPVLPHRICSFCGYYNGKEVIDVLAKLEKKEKKQKEKELKAHAEEAKQEQKSKPLSLEQLSKK
jgi:large subunit ribosomal protein L32